MFSYIKGELAETSYDSIVVEAGGIGYDILISGMDYSLLPAIGSEVKIYTYFVIRENEVALIGFLDRDSLDLFKLLITVNGVGPKNALAILSILTPDDLRFAILSQDAKAINKASGIGPKTAQRVILELKDKLSLEDAFEKKSINEADKALKAVSSSAKDEAVMALTALGYSSTESLKAVSKVEITEDMTTEQILTLALKKLI